MTLAIEIFGVICVVAGLPLFMRGGPGLQIGALGVFLVVAAHGGFFSLS